jgi:hypothetical protein
MLAYDPPIRDATADILVLVQAGQIAVRAGAAAVNGAGAVARRIAPSGDGVLRLANPQAGSLFPQASQLARQLGTNGATFHRVIKPQIVRDFTAELRQLGARNPDIGVDSLGNIMLRNPQTGATITTNTPLAAYRPGG